MDKYDWDQIDITKDSPTEEPARQYYYMKKCREELEKEEKKLGRKLTANVTTFGCQMNVEPATA